MEGAPGRMARRLARGQGGFTLMELLVAVGIIVGLAAAIVPNVVQFSGKGEEGALAAEGEAIQTAFDTGMADQATTTVPARAAPDTSTNLFSAVAVGAGFLSDYLRKDTTTYYYCWNTTGLITRQDTSPAACP